MEAPVGYAAGPAPPSRLRRICAPRGGPTRRQHAGWTSFLTDACLRLQFAWAVRPLRAERTNPLHTQMWRAMPMRPQMDDPSQPQACPIQMTDWRSSGAHRHPWELDRAPREHAVSFATMNAATARDEISEFRPHGLEPSIPELQYPCRSLRGHARCPRASRQTTFDLVTSRASWPASSGLPWWGPRARGAGDSALSSRP